MRFAYLLLVIVACKKAEPTPPPNPPQPPPSDAAVAMADAAAIDAPGGAKIVDVELVQLTAASVRVSSQVRNPNIKPSHLVDKNLATAWNSVTGQLVGAWIEIRPIDGAEIHTIKLTAGSTTKGPKGEDWFTMNPRIRKLRVIADGAPQPDIFLDVDKRELQAFPITASETLRLEVTELVDGTNKRWREISVSELEAWGTTPPGWLSPRPLPSIEVAVGEVADEKFDPCEGLDERQNEVAAAGREYEANCHEQGCDDHAYPPLCAEETPTFVTSLDPVWMKHTIWCESNDEIYGPSACHARFVRGNDIALVEHEISRGHPNMKVSFDMKEVIAQSPGSELVVTFDEDDDDATVIYYAVCRADTFTCSETLETTRGTKLVGLLWVFK